MALLGKAVGEQTVTGTTDWKRLSVRAKPAYGL